MEKEEKEIEIEITFKNLTRLYITSYRIILDKDNLLKIFDINNGKMFYINRDEIIYYSIKLKEETNG